ncbi:MAG: hypothetical protein Q9168_007513 [Polycauliona sp. 1 TL-2023]
MEDHRLFQLRPGKLLFDHGPRSDIQPYWCTEPVEERVGHSKWVVLALKDGSPPPQPIQTHDLARLVTRRILGRRFLRSIVLPSRFRKVTFCDWRKAWVAWPGPLDPLEDMGVVRIAYPVERFAVSKRLITLASGSSPQLWCIPGMVVPGFEGVIAGFAPKRINAKEEDITGGSAKQSPGDKAVFDDKKEILDDHHEKGGHKEDNAEASSSGQTAPTT